MKPSYDDLSNHLMSNSIRPSYQRVRLLEYLMDNQCHPTVEQIYNDMHIEIPSLSKTTIYNTLNTFIKAKLVRVVTIEDHETRYDIVMEEHGHFKCESCKRVYNFTIDVNRLVSDELRDFSISSKDVYFKGICPKCLLK